MKSAQLFQPGSWKGEGTIRLGEGDTLLALSLSFDIAPLITEGGPFDCSQEILFPGYALKTSYTFSLPYRHRFDVQLHHPEWGIVKGQGFLEPGYIGWEFHHKESRVEGFESYQAIDARSYHVEKEFLIAGHLRTSMIGSMIKYADPS